MAPLASVYRALLREARSCPELHLREPVQANLWMAGAHQLYATLKGKQGAECEDVLRRPGRVLPGLQLDQLKYSGAKDLQAAVRKHFREGGTQRPESERLDQAIAALRLLSEQRALHAQSSSCVTEDVRIDAVPGWAGVRSPPGEAQQYCFAYRCTIHNTGSKQRTLQLVGRHWLTLDDRLRLISQVPRGSPGVIGQQPVLEPGACFVYHSGACLPCPGGQMLGHFQMQVLDGLEQEGFDAVIKPFKFLAPAQLQ